MQGRSVKVCVKMSTHVVGLRNKLSEFQVRDKFSILSNFLQFRYSVLPNGNRRIDTDAITVHLVEELQFIRSTWGGNGRNREFIRSHVTEQPTTGTRN